MKSLKIIFFNHFLLNCKLNNRIQLICILCSEHDHPIQKEAKAVMQDLIMAGKGGKYCAVVDTTHMEYITFFFLSLSSLILSPLETGQKKFKFIFTLTHIRYRTNYWEMSNSNDADDGRKL